MRSGSSRGSARLANEYRSRDVERVATASLLELCRQQRHLHRRSEEHTSELQSRQYLVCRLLLEKKKKKHHTPYLRKHKSLQRSTTQYTPPSNHYFLIESAYKAAACHYASPE